MKNPNVTILGATGAVGREMLKILEERNFPIGELRCLASARSVGKKLPFAGREIMVEEATDAAFTDADIVLGAAENDIARRFAPAIKATGAVFIDNSSAFRMDEDVPLVVPEINPEDALHHHGIIANPNCSTIITVVAVAALRRLSPITSMVAARWSWKPRWMPCTKASRYSPIYSRIRLPIILFPKSEVNRMKVILPRK